MMGTIRQFSLALLLGTTAVAPVQAQETAPSDETASSQDKVAVAMRVADKIVPPGSYAEHTVRLMTEEDENGNIAMLQMFDFPLPPDAEKKMSSGKSLLDIMQEMDPYFQERTTIALQVMAEEFTPLFLEFEPDIREAVAKYLARTLSYDELIALEAFVNTPAGAKFAVNILPMLAAPEMMQVNTAMLPVIMEMLPSIMARIDEETSHLPKPDFGEEMEDSDTENADDENSDGEKTDDV